MSAAQRRESGDDCARGWRHEQQSIAAALATFTRHLALRGQKKARARGGGERVALHGRGLEDSSSPAGAHQPVRRRAPRGAACQPGRARWGHRNGFRSAPWSPCWRRLCPSRLSTFLCRSRWARWLEVLRLINTVVPEQVIVPKITSQDVIPQRAVLRVPQVAEQLVTEPTPSFDDFELVEEEERLSIPSLPPHVCLVMFRRMDPSGQ